MQQEEKVLKHAAVCFLRKDNQILLPRKTRKIGMGMRNGYGGGVDGKETPERCAVRETAEEGLIYILPSSMKKIAILTYLNEKQDGGNFVAKVHMFEAWEWKGEPTATEEMSDPVWFPDDDLPLDEMMAADRIWLPEALAGKKIFAHAHYTPLQQALIGEVVMEVVNEFLE